MKGRCDGAKGLVEWVYTKQQERNWVTSAKFCWIEMKQRNGTAGKAGKAQVSFEMGKKGAIPDVDDSKQSEKLTKERKKGNISGPMPLI